MKKIVLCALCCLCLTGCYKVDKSNIISKETFENLKPLESIDYESFSVKRVPGGFDIYEWGNTRYKTFISYEDFMNDDLFWDNL